MTTTNYFYGSCLLLLVAIVEFVQPTCVLESDFGFKINCAFKKSGLFRVRNLGGVKAHASIGFSLGDELGFEQSLTNLDTSRRRSVSVKNGAPLNFISDTSGRPAAKQEKRGKQNRIMMRPMAPATRPNQAAMDKLSSLHQRASSTMRPIVVSGPTAETPNRANPTVTMAKPMPMGVPPFKPLPPKEDSLKVLPIVSSTRKSYTPLQVPTSKGPGPAYQNPVPHQVHDLASMYPAYSTKKVDDYNSITGYGDDTTLKFNKEDINAKIAEIAKAGNISMEAVEAAIALRQQQLLSKYANLPVPTTTTTTTTSTTTTTTEEPPFFQQQPEPEIEVPTQKPKRHPTSGKVMNAPKEYYPVGYEKNFDDHFQSKVDLPDTNFHCGDQKYFPGLYGDESLGCMVFHVCALTDDGLVMKSFLCPESTLFDQTILKCNWWFYVDCKNTRRLYDTNIPVSKSYQLMKALTFFSSYKKEMQADDPNLNPEDVAGIKEAISILENQDTVNNPVSASNGVQYVTPQPQPFVDERNNHKVQAFNETSPVYRGNRNYNESSRKSAVKRKHPETQNKSSEQQRRQELQNSDSKHVTVNADKKIIKQEIKEENSAENNSKANSSETADRKHRRRMTLKNNPSATEKVNSTTSTKTTATATSGERHLGIQTANSTEIKQEKLTDQLGNYDTINPTALNVSSGPVKRFYRSSAETTSNKDEIEMTIVKNEKLQIVRPTSSARLVGEHPTQTATIQQLDAAVLGSSSPSRVKKETIAVVTPQRNENVRSETNRYGTYLV
ncbi:hypothetical protein NE865_03130 [Phthorimaea operculella]|nr:hypothetical protein NE865_03130 [Phthorimaea operculella]